MKIIDFMSRKAMREAAKDNNMPFIWIDPLPGESNEACLARTLASRDELGHYDKIHYARWKSEIAVNMNPGGM